MCYIASIKAARELEVKHVPEDAQFDVSLFVTYPSAGADFSICCMNYSYE